MFPSAFHNNFSNYFCLQIPIVFTIFVAGEVLLDGVNIKNLKLEWLRSQIGLVTQEPALLSLSIRDNIAYGRNASSDEIEEAAKVAHAHAFISSLEKGYDTQVETRCTFRIVAALLASFLGLRSSCCKSF